MAEMTLPNGMVARFDDEDLPLVGSRTWFAQKSGGRHYVATKQMRDGRTKVEYLHRLILESDRERVRFRNGDPLDCRKDNLQVSGHSAPSKSYARGAVGEAMVIADLASRGYDVFVPISGHTAADLISIKPGHRPLRWQVKYRAVTPGTSSLRIKLSAIQPRNGGYREKPYDRTAIDGFAVYCPSPEGVYYVSVDDIDWTKGVFSLCLGPRAGGESYRDALNHINPDINVTIPVTL